MTNLTLLVTQPLNEWHDSFDTQHSEFSAESFESVKHRGSLSEMLGSCQTPKETNIVERKLSQRVMKIQFVRKVPHIGLICGYVRAPNLQIVSDFFDQIQLHDLCTKFYI